MKMDGEKREIQMVPPEGFEHSVAGIPSEIIEPCPECGGTSLRAFVWRLIYLENWARNLFCESCGEFLVDFRSPELNYYGKVKGRWVVV